LEPHPTWERSRLYSTRTTPEQETTKNKKHQRKKRKKNKKKKKSTKTGYQEKRIPGKTQPCEKKNAERRGFNGLGKKPTFRGGETKKKKEKNRPGSEQETGGKNGGGKTESKDGQKMSDVHPWITRKKQNWSFSDKKIRRKRLTQKNKGKQDRKKEKRAIGSKQKILRTNQKRVRMSLSKKPLANLDERKRERTRVRGGGGHLGSPRAADSPTLRWSTENLTPESLAEPEEEKEEIGKCGKRITGRGRGKNVK